MTETKIADLVGLAEIAERCEVTKNVASGWTRKHDFPRPKHKLAMGPMWDWNEVLAWKTPPPLGADFINIAPGCFADSNKRVINWLGLQFYRRDDDKEEA